MADGYSTVDPSAMNAWANVAQQVYNQSMAANEGDKLAFAKAQAALAQAMGYSSTFGQAPGGDWLTWGAGGPSQPVPGTYTQSALQQAFGQGTTAAGLTGYYANPQTWAYQPGTWVRNSDTGQVGQVSAGGRLVTTQTLPSGLDVNAIPNVDSYLFGQLQLGQGGGPGGGVMLAPTQQAVDQAARLAYNQAQSTGLYQQPMGNIAQDAWTKASPQTQQAYLANTGGDPGTAANRYWSDVQGAIQQAGLTPQQFVYGTNGPQATLAMQQAYGSYGVPTAGQKTMAQQEQDYTQWLRTTQEARLNQQLQQQTAQYYLQLLSNLRGPADYAKYQQVLGATPGGMSDLVRAAAGQYIPGGGATTGVQPTAVNLQNFVGTVGGGANQEQQNLQNSLVAPNQMAPQTWNALSPSQQQMLLGTWEAQGYTQEDAKNLFQQSLPRYATSTPATGQFRLQ